MRYEDLSPRLREMPITVKVVYTPWLFNSTLLIIGCVGVWLLTRSFLVLAFTFLASINVSLVLNTFTVTVGDALKASASIRDEQKVREDETSCW